VQGAVATDVTDVSGVSGPTPPEYWAELEAIWEGRSSRPAPVHPGPVRSGALAAAVLLGVGEVLEPVRRREQVVVEVDADGLDRRVPGRVHVWLDPGSARRSVAVVPRP
jgi:hypothetical protein